MRTAFREDGFTLVELLVSTAITLVVLGTAMTTFQNALTLHQTSTLVSDANQNLRAGTNVLVRELMQAGRGIPVGGISIPSGVGSTPINRPSPPGKAYQFDNVTATSIQAITTGSLLGPTINNETTDMITFLAADYNSRVQYTVNGVPDELLLNVNLAGPAGTFPVGLVAPAPTLSADGQTITIGSQFATWISDPIDGIKPGDLMMFQNVGGNNTVQTVTAVTPTTVTFQPSNTQDWFNFNQPGAAAGNITQLADTTVTPAVFGQMSVVRVVMLTYYVDATKTANIPRLFRQQNNFAAQALAGVVEDLNMTYDLVDGINNPTRIASLPYTRPGPPAVTYTATQIRKVNVHMGVRSEQFSNLTNDYLRHHLSTGVSVRNLAFTDRYK
jgi:type II secretory pathway pseudopilin PulG